MPTRKRVVNISGVFFRFCRTSRRICRRTSSTGLRPHIGSEITRVDSYHLFRFWLKLYNQSPRVRRKTYLSRQPGTIRLVVNRLYLWHRNKERENPIISVRFSMKALPFRKDLPGGRTERQPASGFRKRIRRNDTGTTVCTLQPPGRRRTVVSAGPEAIKKAVPRKRGTAWLSARIRPRTARHEKI